MTYEAGQRLLHYRIIEKVGAGGMGEVWRAEDTKLGRQVALKVLPPEVADSPERSARFEREARAVAALSHPNIVTIYSVEEAGPTPFLTMELVSGSSLERLIPENGFELARLFDLAIPMADAIAAAHDKGITHRDLKPGNVMVPDDGQLKILDFGLAKLQFQRTTGVDDPTEAISREGLVVGTVPYMSPEQLQGKSVDHRTDVFSLGVILYELATGQRPFRGDNQASLVSSILRDAPRPVSELNASLPYHLGRVIQRCLEKDPERRFQTAKDVRNELVGLRDEVQSGTARSADTAAVRSVPSDTAQAVDSVVSTSHAVSAGASSRPGRALLWIAVVALAAVVLTLAVLNRDAWFGGRADQPGRGEASSPGLASARTRLVVLPFDNLGTPDDDFFAAGITDEINSRLATVEGLAVISRKSAQTYAGTEKGIRQIGDELGVDYVVGGTVRWARMGDGASRVRITPELIDVAADTNVWSQVYDREIDDIFDIQAEIAQQVVGKLGLTLLGAQEDAAARPTENLEAYQAYLRGNYFWDSPSGTPAEFESAIASYTRAVELDPGFVEAWSRMSRVHSFTYHSGFDVSVERQELAREALEAAAAIAPDSVPTYLARGYYHYHGFKEYEPALEQFRLAAEREPDNVEALEGEAFILRRYARFDETVQLLERVAAINPRDSQNFFNLAETLVYDRRYDDALAAYDQSVALQPRGNNAAAYRAWPIWLSKGQRGLPEARDALETAAIDPSDHVYRFHWFWQRMYERQPEQAADALRSTSDGPWVRIAEHSAPQSLYEAFAMELAGREDEARELYRIAADLLDAEIERTPDDYRLPGPLGIALAALGEREAAIEAADRGVEMMPMSKDSLQGPPRRWERAVVHAKLDNADAAIDDLEAILEFSGMFSIALLELDPMWDAIRDHPRFEALLADSR